jgi:regulator of sigma E protease
MEVLSQIFYFIIIIGVLVFVHELGHFAAAKLFKMRVERFSIGFPPRAFGKTFGDTDYCVSWLPIGGYVKISGMIDESLDTEHLDKEPEPWEFRAKPVWQRMIVIVAGVVMNVVLAVGIFWGLNITKGKEFHEITTIGYVSPSTVAGQSGLLQGDDITSVNGKSVTTWEDILTNIYVSQISEDLSISVNRDGSKETIHIAKDKIPNLNEEPFGILPAGSKARVGNVQSGMPAAKVGLEQGDVFVSINDETIRASEDVTRIINKHPDEPVKVIWTRDGEEMASLVTPNTDGMIGIMVESFYPGPVRVERYGVFEALSVGVTDLNGTVTLFVESIWNIIIGKSSFSKNIGGPVKIAEMAAQSAELGLSRFLTLMAILSISLAIINIIPFPGLDGGHFGFLLYEAVFRREVPRKIYLAMQQAGMVLLIAFMIFVIYNDFVN